MGNYSKNSRLLGKIKIPKRSRNYQMPTKKEKLKTLHVDFYNPDEKERIDWLKDYSGITSDAELVRWILRELERRLVEEQKDRDAARVAFKKSFQEQ